VDNEIRQSVQGKKAGRQRRLTMEPIQNSRLRQSLNDSNDFTLTFELVPGRGGRTKEINRIVNLAKEIAADGRFQALSITENAGGHPALSH